MDCDSGDDKRKTMLNIDRHVGYTIVSDEIESLIGMMSSVGSLLDVIGSKKGFRDLGKTAQKRKAMQRIQSMVHHQKTYVKYRLNRIECFIKCIEVLGNETTALRENHKDLETANDKIQKEIDESVSKLTQTNNDDELTNIAKNIRNRTNESFTQLSKPLRNLETELRERAEGSIRIHLEDKDQKLSDFAGIIMNSNRDNSKMMDDMK